MKHSRLFFLLLTLACVFSGESPIALAESAVGGGVVEFDGEITQGIYDPENPEKLVDPGESPKTDFDLRIDFVPRFRFGENKALSEDTAYPAFAQNFLDDTPARGNFIQISDFRSAQSGWQLSMRQESQFRNRANQELKGAWLSFDRSWVNSKQDMRLAPIVQKDVINVKVGESTLLAKADNGKGMGVWSIVFGASALNSNNQKDTLTPLLDRSGQTVHDPLFNNKPIYLNSAVQLNVPGKTDKQLGTSYQTVITWTLSELP